MQTEALIQILTELGLSDKEAKVYLASLSIGSAAIQRITRTANIKRTTGYPVVNKLTEMGLMAREIKGLKETYVAENPAKLESMLELKRKKFHSLLPQLTGLYELQGNDSDIKHYQGLSGVKSVYEQLLADIKPHQEYLVISDEQRWLELDEKYFTNFLRQRAKLRIDIRMLLQDTPVARKAKKFERNLNQKIKLLPGNTTLLTNMVITPQKIVIHQLIPPINAIVIKNQSTILTLQQVFDIMWQSLA
jgi:HTH-type transcriptional regulator, sugar sensing transcriptional regulator